MEERPDRPVDHPRVPVPDVRVGPGDDVAGRLVERLPERLALAPERAVAGQDVGMLDDPGALGLGDLAGPVRRRRIDDDDLVEERHPADHLADRPPDDRADRLLLVERRQDEADREALLLLELDEPAQVRELAVVEVRFAEPALDAGRHGPGLLGRPVGGGEGLGPRRQLLERLAADGLARLDDDDGRARARGDRLGHRPEQVRRDVARGRRGRRAHDHEIGPVGLAEDRVPDVGRLPDDRLDPGRRVLPDEGGEGPLGLGPDGEGDPRRDDVEGHEVGVVAEGDRVGEAEGQLGVGTAADRHHDPPDLAGPALLHDGDVAGRVANDLLDRRRERGDRGIAVGGRLAAPAEDDEVGVELGGRFDDPLGGVAADPDDRVDRRALGHEVEDLLEEPAGVAGPGGALRERHALGDLDDAQRGQLAGPRLAEVGAEADQLLGRGRVGDGDDDPGGQRRAHASVRAASSQRVRRYGLSRSNSRAWRSTAASALSVVSSRFSMTNEATRPK